MDRPLTDFSRPDRGTAPARDYAIVLDGDGGAAGQEERLEARFGTCDALRRWASGQGRPLADGAVGLEVLEELLTEPGEGLPPPWRLRIEAGLFIGTVLVRRIPTACWRVLPNGHPVVHLCRGTDLDVVALARARLEVGEPDLREVVPYAERLVGRVLLPEPGGGVAASGPFGSSGRVGPGAAQARQRPVQEG